MWSGSASRLRCRWQRGCDGRWTGADYLRILDHVLGAMLRVEFTTEGREITDFADEGCSVVLVAADGSSRVLKPELLAH